MEVDSIMEKLLFLSVPVISQILRLYRMGGLGWEEEFLKYA